MSDPGRLLALLRAAEVLRDPKSDVGQDFRHELVEESGLSPEMVDFTLEHCLEVKGGRSALLQLPRVVPSAPRSHVVLAANVYVGAFRAIALALCQSAQVEVRASRRSMTFARFLHEEAQGAFSLVNELEVAARDHVWAYGADATLDTIKKRLPPGSFLHRHGSGMGGILLRSPTVPSAEELRDWASKIALDLSLFDQRGCLSPRFLLVEGPREVLSAVADALYFALIDLEKLLPRGELEREELIDTRSYQQTIQYLGSAARAGAGWLFVDPVEDRLMIPPIGRNLHLARTEDAFAVLQPLGKQLTTLASNDFGQLEGRLRSSWQGQVLPGGRLDTGNRRFVGLGEMQTPRLDGPVDLRAGYQTERIE